MGPGAASKRRRIGISDLGGFSVPSFRRAGIILVKGSPG
jgi:hypothetical protein